MSKSVFALAAAILISLPCLAIADVYPNASVPLPPGVTPQRLSPRQIFHWLDTNHDGYLSLNEFLAAPWIKNKQQAARFFRWMDTNHDGLVSLEEFLAAYARYSGSSGYWVRTAYPWAWACWRPWRYGWYWQGGWHRHGGTWGGYAGNPHPRAVGSHHAGRNHAGKHAGAGKHHHAAKHVKKPAKPKHHGKHKGHGHGHGHAGSHSKHR